MTPAKFKAALDQVMPVTRSRDDALVKEAKILAHLQIKRRALRKQLREIDRQIAVTKKNVKRLIAEGDHDRWDESGAGSKILNALPGGTK